MSASRSDPGHPPGHASRAPVPPYDPRRDGSERRAAGGDRHRRRRHQAGGGPRRPLHGAASASTCASRPSQRAGPGGRCWPTASTLAEQLAAAGAGGGDRAGPLRAHRPRGAADERADDRLARRRRARRVRPRRAPRGRVRRARRRAGRDPLRRRRRHPRGALRDGGHRHLVHARCSTACRTPGAHGHAISLGAPVVEDVAAGPALAAAAGERGPRRSSPTPRSPPVVDEAAPALGTRDRGPCQRARPRHRDHRRRAGAERRLPGAGRARHAAADLLGARGPPRAGRARAAGHRRRHRRRRARRRRRAFTFARPIHPLGLRARWTSTTGCWRCICCRRSRSRPRSCCTRCSSSAAGA